MRNTPLRKDVIAVVEKSDTPIQTPEIIRNLIGSDLNAPRFVDNLCDLVLVLQDGTLQCNEHGWIQPPIQRNETHVAQTQVQYKRRIQKCKYKNGE